MTAKPHVLVLGLGIAGSSIAATLAGEGFRVTAFEQFTALHERGSSHGDSRIYRRVPHEGDVYVDMAARSWDSWNEWSAAAGEALLVPCGGIDAGPEGSAIVLASEALGKRYGKPCEMLTGAAVNRKYPHYSLPAEWIAAYQPQSGFVRPDATRSFLHELARQAGARLRHEARVAIEPRSAGVAVRAGGETISGDVLIVTAGSWLPRLLPELALPLRTERRVMAWFRPQQDEQLSDGRLPIFCLDGEGGWYGMPTLDGRVKLGHNHHFNEPIDPDQPTIHPGDADAARLAPCIERYFRGFDPAAPAAMKACIYTLMPDHNFVIDRHPANANVLVFSCCSGHGFKYAPEYGKIAVDLVNGKPRPDLGALGLQWRGPGAVWAG